MQSSSRTRRKHSFVPWLAALLMGASAHAGWLIHELRDEHGAAAPVVVQIELDERAQPERARHLHRMRAPTPMARAHARRTEACEARHRVGERPPADLDLDLFVEQTDRYHYSIDRRALEQLTVAELDSRLEQLGVFARALTLAEPIELRNIQQGTHLWLLGLRNGDQLRTLATKGEPALEQVEVELLRRGRAITIVYALS